MFDYGGGRLTFHTATWNANNQVYVGCLEGQLLLFAADSDEGHVVVDSEGHDHAGISSVMLTAKHLITAGKDGRLRFYDGQHHSLEKTVSWLAVLVVG